jgi:two-component system alkaline phosphatase synthesis response regulator PhoP
MSTILVVDDETNILELIKFNLEKEKFRVITASDGISGLTMAQEYMPDLIILDIMMPDKDGFEVCRTLRAKKNTAVTPIIMLSAKGELMDKVIGLEMGADDYITKPFSTRELLARVKANLRRREFNNNTASGIEEKEIRHSNMVIRPERFEAVVDGMRLDLSPKEFEILHVLASNPGRVFTRDSLLEKIWGFDAIRETRTVDVHIRYLRQKIERDPGNPEYIETVRGVGYRFSDRSRI